jgi:hypothetical protein
MVAKKNSGSFGTFSKHTVNNYSFKVQQLKMRCVAFALSLLLVIELIDGFRPIKPSIRSSLTRVNLIPDASQIITSFLSNNGFNIALDDGSAAAEAVNAYSKVDKTGFIGFIATYIEIAIDFFHSTFLNLGVPNSYGYAIIVLTLIGNFF